MAEHDAGEMMEAARLARVSVRNLDPTALLPKLEYLPPSITFYFVLPSCLDGSFNRHPAGGVLVAVRMKHEPIDHDIRIPLASPSPLFDPFPPSTIISRIFSTQQRVMF